MGEFRYYIALMLIGICIILMIFSFITNSVSKRRRFSLFVMALSSMMLLISDMLNKFYNGYEGDGFSLLLKITKFNVYFLFLVIIYAFNQYLIDLFAGYILKKLKYVEYLVYTGTFFLVFSQFTGFYYSYNENNVYHRSGGYAISYFFPLLSIILQFLVIIEFKAKVKKQLIPLALFTIAPFFAAILQFFLHDVSFTNITIVSMVVLLYSFNILYTNRLVETAHQKEIQNFNLMISQTTEALASAIDAKDEYTNGHSKRVAEYSYIIAKKARKSQKECEEIYLIGMLHDVGKIGVPDKIINKNGKLTAEEFYYIKQHPIIGKEILSKISSSPNLKIGAYHHHERYDGKGYPEGLKGEAIPEIARIIAVADSYDAMTSKRSYRDCLPQQVVRSEIEKGIGTQFDPQFARIMIEIIDCDDEYQLRQM